MLTSQRGQKRPTYGQRVPKVNAQGYLRVWAPEHPVAYGDGTALVHRMVWHDANGTIPAGFDVHHRNEDKTDNRIKNLILLSNVEHQAEHNIPGTTRRNQYGEFAILTPEGRRERSRRRAYWRKVLGREGAPPPEWECPPRAIPFIPRKKTHEKC